jgi:histidine triad (HIT) family protein
MDSPDCLFCKLKNAEKSIVYQDNTFYVLVDRYPMSNRHLLIIPKTHCPVLHECDDPVLNRMLILAKKLALKLKLDKYNIIQNNVNQQDIHHVHLHLVGCNSSGSFKFGSFNTLTFSENEYFEVVEEVKEILKN